MLDSLRPSVTTEPGDLTPSSELHVNMNTHVYTYTETHLHILLKRQQRDRISDFKIYYKVQRFGLPYTSKF